jgi:hypothetical protein
MTMFIILVAAVGVAVLSVFSFFGIDTIETKDRYYISLPDKLGKIELSFDRSKVGFFEDSDRIITHWSDKRHVSINFGQDWGPVNIVSVYLIDHKTILIADCVNASIIDIQKRESKRVTETELEQARMHVGSFISGTSKGLFVSDEEPMPFERLRVSC